MEAGVRTLRWAVHKHEPQPRPQPLSRPMRSYTTDPVRSRSKTKNTTETNDTGENARESWNGGETWEEHAVNFSVVKGILSIVEAMSRFP